MADPRPFERFIPPWRRWVEDRRAIWSHAHVSALLLGDGDDWVCVTSTIVLAENSECQAPSGVGPSLEREVCAFRLALGITSLGPLLDGLEVGEWPAGLLRDIPGRIRLNPVDGKRLEPTGDPRLESPNMGHEVVHAEAQWPRYTVELQGPALHEWLGQERYPKIEALDRRLMGIGRPGLSELAAIFGTLTGSGGHVSDLWNRQLGMRLVAPVRCRMNRARWVSTRGEFVAPFEIGTLIPRDRVKVLLHDPYTLGFTDPVQLPGGSGPTLEVALSKTQPGERAEVRLLFFEEVLQTERTGPGTRSFSFPDTGQDDDSNVEGPGAWIRIRPLAVGGQAKVSIARKDGQLGALKEVKDGRSEPVRLTRLRREIAFLRRFNGLPFLAQLLDSSAEDDEVPYLVTELAPLGSAEDQKSIFKGDIWRVLRLARDVASALEGLHKAEVVHRDIKPKNILLFTPDRVALADLGVAYDAGQTGLTTVAELVDSGWFSPPEHEGRGRPTPAYDSFMLGKTIYYLLTEGKRYRDHDFAAPEWSLARVVGEVAAHPLNTLLAQLVAQKPSDRLCSMSDVIRALDETLTAVFGGRGRSGLCNSCGRATYQRAGELVLTQANLHIDLPSGGQEHLGHRCITLSACPQCGDCRFELAETSRRSLVGSLQNPSET